MDKLNFLKGLDANLPSNLDANNFYTTTDTNRFFVGKEEMQKAAFESISSSSTLSAATTVTDAIGKLDTTVGKLDTAVDKLDTAVEKKQDETIDWYGSDEHLTTVLSGINQTAAGKANIIVVDGAMPTTDVKPNSQYWVTTKDGTVLTSGRYIYVTDANSAATYVGTSEADLSTYVKKSNVVNNLTSTTTDAPLSAYQGKVLNEKMLPLSGGTMTGQIKTTETESLANATDSSYTWHYGGTGYWGGAGFLAYAKDYSTNQKGSASIMCWDGTNRKYLSAFPDGGLFWNDSVILREENVSNYCLPLSGGTMNGGITFNTSEAMGRSVNDDWVAILGGNSYESAYLSVEGKDKSGDFYLAAANGTAKSELHGKPDGTLTWGGKDVLVDDDWNEVAVTLSAGTSGEIHVLRLGRMVQVVFSGVRSTSGGDIVTIGSIPEGYNPYYFGFFVTSTTGNATCLAGVSTVGKIYLYGYTANTTLYGSIMYACKIS